MTDTTQAGTQIDVEYDVKWKRPSEHKVPARVAHREIERLRRETGELDLDELVKESTPPDAPLHPEFEWRDDVAAHKYRVVQAERIVDSLVVVEVETAASEPASYDIVEGIRESRQPPRHPPQKNIAIRRAVVELEMWLRRHSQSSDLEGAREFVQKAIDAAMAELVTIWRDAG